MAHDELLPRLTRYLDYFQALTEVAKTLTSNLRHTEVLQTVMQCITQLLQPKHWSLLLVDEQKQDLYFEIAVGEAADKIKNLRLKIGEGLVGWTAKHREPVVVARVADDPRFSRRLDEASNFQTASVLCVPLVCRDKLLGVIELVKDASDPAPYGQEHLEILAPLADFAAIAIENARTFKRVEELTTVDEWTTLYNARFLRACLEDEVLRAQRYRRELSVVFLDLDNFKKVNDTQGHAAGSALLREVGLLLKDSVRETDRAVRYGGDEFVVVMPETPKSGALELAARLQKVLAEKPFRHDNGPELTITGSFGVACFPTDADDPQKLLEAADRAMYLAKAKGRNAVVDIASLR